MTVERAISMMKQEQESIVDLREQEVFQKDVPLSETMYGVFDMGIKAIQQVETIKGIINLPVYIQEDVLRYKMICKVFEE